MLSIKEGSEKLIARRSAKLKKIKQQVRKSVVVVKHKKKSDKSSQKEGNSIRSFDTIQSDNEPTMDNFKNEVKLENGENMKFRASSSAVSLGMQSQDNIGYYILKNDNTSGPEVQGNSLKSFESFSPESPKTSVPAEVSEPIPDSVIANTSAFNTHSTNGKSLRARNLKMENVVGTLMTIGKTIKKWTELFGLCHLI